MAESSEEAPKQSMAIWQGPTGRIQLHVLSTPDLVLASKGRKLEIVTSMKINRKWEGRKIKTELKKWYSDLHL